MNDKEFSDLLEDAIEHFGERRQLVKLAEECSELSAAVLKYVEEPSPATKAAMIEEMADVDITLEQGKRIVGGCNLQRLRKLVRLSDRIQTERENADTIPPTP